MFAERAGDGLQRIELEVVRENPQRDALPGDLGRCGRSRALEADTAILRDLARGALAHVIRWWRQRAPRGLFLAQSRVNGRAGGPLDVGEPHLHRPRLPWIIEIGQVGPRSATEEPLADGIPRLLDLALGSRVAGQTPVDGQPILPGTGDGFGVSRAAQSSRVLDHRLSPIIETLVPHAPKACQGVLVAGPKCPQVLSVGVLHRGIPTVAQHHMEGIQGAGIRPDAGLLIAPIHLSLWPGSRLNARMHWGEPWGPEGPDQPWHNRLGPRKAVVGPQVIIDACGLQPGSSGRPWLD